MINNLKELLIHEIRDLYSAETQLVDALPGMARSALNEELKVAFSNHLEETKKHVSRLSEAAEKLSVSPEGETCEAMKGLLREAEETMKIPADPSVKDAALIAAAQRVEHYEMAGYGSAACFAECAKENDVGKLLLETLDEEKEADQKLSSIAKGGLLQSGVNDEAVDN